MSHSRHPVRIAARRAAAALIERFERRTLMSAGALDPTFGTAGVTLTGGGPSLGSSTAVAVDARGRTLLGITEEEPFSGPAGSVRRLNADGSVDTTFGYDGTANVGDGPDAGYFGKAGNEADQVLPMADGDTLVVGPYILEELTPAGQPDPRFGGGGSDDVGKGSGYLYTTDNVAAVALLPGGKFVAAAYFNPGDGTGTNLVIERFNAEGSLDTTYGTGGQTTLSPPGTVEDTVGAGAITVDAAGRAVVSFGATLAAGPTAAATEYGLVRVTAAGRVDTTFGTAGFATTPADVNGGGTDQPGGALAVAPGGTIYQAVNSAFDDGTAEVYQPSLFAYSADGKHRSGGPVGPATDQEYAFHGVAVGSDGKPVVVGERDDAGLVARFLPITPTSAAAAPAFDPTFAASGSVALTFPSLVEDGLFGTTAGAPAEVAATAVTPDAAGRLVVSSGTDAGTAVVRVLAAGPSAVTPAVATGAVIGTPGSYKDRGNTIAKAFDGDPNTFYDAPAATGDWAGLDLGGAVAPLVQVAFAPRTGFANRMIGGQFQTSSTPDFSADVTTVYTITKAPAVGTLTTVAVGPTAAARYVRYLGPAGGECNVAELQFRVAGASQLDGTVIGTAGSYQGKGDTIANALDGSTGTFFDAPTPTGDFVGLDFGQAQAVTQVRFAPRAGFAFRMVGGTIQASNSADFSAGVVTAYTIRSSPPAGTLTTVSLPALAAFRYWRYAAPAGSSGNIAELEFDG